MIRSLVFSQKTEIDQNFIGASNRLRRNLNQENLEQALAAGCSIWLDIISPEVKEIHWIETWLNLSPVVVADLLREDRRPTLLVYPQYLFLSLFQPYTHNKKLLGKEIHCIVGELYFITVRNAEATVLEEAYVRVTENPDSWNRGVGYFLYLTAQHIIDTYYPLLDRINTQLNELEEKLMSNSNAKQAQRSVYLIKQNLIGLRQMIAPQREVGEQQD